MASHKLDTSSDITASVTVSRRRWHTRTDGLHATYDLPSAAKGQLYIPDAFTVSGLPDTLTLCGNDAAGGALVVTYKDSETTKNRHTYSRADGGTLQVHASWFIGAPPAMLALTGAEWRIGRKASAKVASATSAVVAAANRAQAAITGTIAVESVVAETVGTGAAIMLAALAPTDLTSPLLPDFAGQQAVAVEPKSAKPAKRGSKAHAEHVA